MGGIGGRVPAVGKVSDTKCGDSLRSFSVGQVDDDMAETTISVEFGLAISPRDMPRPFLAPGNTVAETLAVGLPPTLHSARPQRHIQSSSQDYT